MTRKFTSRLTEVGAAAAASLQRLERQIGSLHAWLDTIEARLNKLKMLRRASADAERSPRNSR